MEEQNKVMMEEPNDDLIEDVEDHMVQKHYLMGRRPHGFPVSRDWADVDCKAVGCLFNRKEKCMTPARCKIGENGSCQGFEPIPPKQEMSGD